MTIKYRKGYKYQLAENYLVKVDIEPVHTIITEFVILYINNRLWIKQGYAWDGPSGPAIHTKNFMRGSLVHDAIYQLMRQGHLDIKWREQADKELKRICLEDGMSKIRAWWVYRAVRRFAKRAALPENRKKVFTAP